MIYGFMLLLVLANGHSTYHREFWHKRCETVGTAAVRDKKAVEFHCYAMLPPPVVGIEGYIQQY